METCYSSICFPFFLNANLFFLLLLHLSFCYKSVNYVFPQSKKLIIRWMKCQMKGIYNNAAPTPRRRKVWFSGRSLPLCARTCDLTCLTWFSKISGTLISIILKQASQPDIHKLTPLLSCHREVLANVTISKILYTAISFRIVALRKPMLHLIMLLFAAFQTPSPSLLQLGPDPQLPSISWHHCHQWSNAISWKSGSHM